MNTFSNGHSLLELMVVAAIAGSVMITAPPIISWMNLSGVRHAAENLYAELQLARLSAIRNKHPCALVFTTQGSNQYCNSLTHQCVPLAQYWGGVQFMRIGPNGKPMATEIRFNRQGMSMSIAPVHVYLTNKDRTAIYRIRVMLPGGLSLERWNGKDW